jgi:hypothetical protein
MIPFEHRGRDWQEANRLRRVLLEALLIVLAILLFPFVLLVLLFLSMNAISNARAGG